MRKRISLNLASPEKQMEAQELGELTKQFLSGGNKITKVPAGVTRLAGDKPTPYDWRDGITKDVNQLK